MYTDLCHNLNKEILGFEKVLFKYISFKKIVSISSVES